MGQMWQSRARHLVIQRYGHWKHMLIDTESTTLLFKRNEYCVIEL